MEPLLLVLELLLLVLHKTVIGTSAAAAVIPWTACTSAAAAASPHTVCTSAAAAVSPHTVCTSAAAPVIHWNACTSAVTVLRPLLFLGLLVSVLQLLLVPILSVPVL